MDRCIAFLLQTAATAPEHLSDSVAVSVGLALARGSLPALLRVARFLLIEASAGGGGTLNGRARESLRQLSNRPSVAELNVFGGLSATGGAASPAQTRGRPFKVGGGEKEKVYFSSIATDGRFVYVHDTNGLVKVGTGKGGSEPGKV